MKLRTAFKTGSHFNFTKFFLHDIDIVTRNILDKKIQRNQFKSTIKLISRKFYQKWVKLKSNFHIAAVNLICHFFFFFRESVFQNQQYAHVYFWCTVENWYHTDDIHNSEKGNYAKLFFWEAPPEGIIDVKIRDCDTVWKIRKFTLIWKIFREINL